MNNFWVGLFLAYKAIRRTSMVSLFFIILIMTMTFINLLIVRGVLVGIPDSSLANLRADNTGDVVISKIEEESEIKQTYQIIQYLDALPAVQAYSVRYGLTGTIESDYQRNKKVSLNQSRRSANIRGIDPVDEQLVTGFEKFIRDGRFFQPGEYGGVLIGSGLLSDPENPNFTGEDLLQNVTVDSKVLLTVDGQTKEYRVLGILEAKNGEIDNRIYMLDKEVLRLSGQSNLNAIQIAIRLNNPDDDARVVAELKAAGFARYSKIETSFEAAGEFLTDIKTIFDFLSGFIGLIAVFISAITIFIIIFINAVARRKEIGILRALGIDKGIIQISYIFQSFFYALCGIGTGLALYVLSIEPYFQANPINFPFTDVFLATDWRIITIQISLLLGASFFAAFIPARMILRRPILDLILGK